MPQVSPIAATWPVMAADCIHKARQQVDAHVNAGRDHFVDVTEMVQIGSGAARKTPNVHLTRFAAYFVVLNAGAPPLGRGTGIGWGHAGGTAGARRGDGRGHDGARRGDTPGHAASTGHFPAPSARAGGRPSTSGLRM